MAPLHISLLQWKDAWMSTTSSFSPLVLVFSAKMYSFRLSLISSQQQLFAKKYSNAFTTTWTHKNNQKNKETVDLVVYWFFSLMLFSCISGPGSLRGFHNGFRLCSPTLRSYSPPCSWTSLSFRLRFVTLQHCSLPSSGKIILTLSNPASLIGDRGGMNKGSKELFFPPTVRLYLLWVLVAWHNATHQLHAVGFFQFVGPVPLHLCHYWNQII